MFAYTNRKEKLMAIKLTNPITRLSNGWNIMGAFKRQADTRTAEELTESIKLWANQNPEVKAFLPHLKEMNQKHLGLVADTIELANHKALRYNDVNMLGKTSAGKSLLGVLLDIFPKASKENPNALDFAQEVINNTDAVTSKYFLWLTTGGVLHNKNVAEHFKAAKPLVEIFAKQTLNPPNPMTFDNQNNFMFLIKNVINESADVEKVKLVKDAFHAIDEKGYMYVNDFVLSKTPIGKIQDNLKSLPQVADMFKANNKLLNAGEFLEKNTNLY